MLRSVVFVVDQCYWSRRVSWSDHEQKHFPQASARKATHLDLLLWRLSDLSYSTNLQDRMLMVGRKGTRCIGRSES
jgi:hypothetical protein